MKTAHIKANGIRPKQFSEENSSLNVYLLEHKKDWEEKQNEAK